MIPSSDCEYGFPILDFSNIAAKKKQVNCFDQQSADLIARKCGYPRLNFSHIAAKKTQVNCFDEQSVDLIARK